jgi:hypothetical protein
MLKSFTCFAISLGISLGGIAAPVVAQRADSKPMAAGTEPRHDGWESDGAPSPPEMWRGRGGTMWADHFHACRKQYGKRYDYSRDMVGKGRKSQRCTL